MKLVFAIDGNGLLGELGDWIRLAIDSARINTSLDILVLVDGITPSFEYWLRQEGIEYLQARTPLSPLIEDLNRDSGYPLQAKGNYLRYEALRCVEDDFFFYTDCDVVFLSDPGNVEDLPALVAACPADTPYSYSSFNSGVLLFNRQAMLSYIDKFYEFAGDRLLSFLPGFDQVAFNAFFKDMITPLPTRFNWRPHWGATEDLSMLHFHGVKLSVIEELLSGRLPFFGPKADQVLDLGARAVTHLPFFMQRIGRPLIERHEILQRLHRLAEVAIEANSAPIATLMKTARTLRAELECEPREVFGAWTRDICLEERRIAPKLIELSPADYPTIRIIIRTASPVIYLSGLMSRVGDLVHPITSGININCYFARTFEINGLQMTEIHQKNTRIGMDFVFNNKDFSIDYLKVMCYCIAPVRLEYYHSRDGQFVAGESAVFIS